MCQGSGGCVHGDRGAVGQRQVARHGDQVVNADAGGRVDRSKAIVAPLPTESEAAVNVPTEPGAGLGPGESVPPLLSVTAPPETAPLPLSVAPEATVTPLPVSAPLTISTPELTFVPPV